jgi:hypothetical protein
MSTSAASAQATRAPQLEPVKVTSKPLPATNGSGAGGLVFLVSLLSEKGKPLLSIHCRSSACVRIQWCCTCMEAVCVRVVQSEKRAYLQLVDSVWHTCAQQYAVLFCAQCFVLNMRCKWYTASQTPQQQAHSLSSACGVTAQAYSTYSILAYNYISIQ